MHKRPGPACCENARYGSVTSQQRDGPAKGACVLNSLTLRPPSISSLVSSRRNNVLSQSFSIPRTAQNCHPCLGHSVTHVLAMFCYRCLGLGPSRKAARVTRGDRRTPIKVMG
jgi:hypothetical protein